MTIQRISTLFQGLERAHGIFNITHTDNGKIKGKPYTLHEPVTIDLWQQHLEGINGLGIVPITDDATARWGVIDIDNNDINHVALERKIKEYKLPLVVCRSKSGGAHLFLFTKEFVSAQDIRAKLEECAAGLGFSTVEIFPKQSKLASLKDVGNWLNMPYFGIVGAQKTTMRYCIKDGKGIQDLNQFLDYAESMQITHAELLAITIEAKEEFKDAPPCIQYLTNHGVYSHRNNCLVSLGVFARKKYSDTWQTKIDEYNQKYMDPLGSAEVQGVIKSISKKKYFYKCGDEPLISHCNKTLCRKSKYGIGNDDLDLDIKIDGIQKLDTNPPVWFLNVLAPDGSKHRIAIDDTAKLLNQQEFNVKCMETLNILPITVKANKWYSYISKAIVNVEIIEAPKEASADGILMDLLQDYLIGKAQAKSREELGLGKPWLDDVNQLYYFKSNKFLDYALQKGGRWFAGWKPSQFYSVLKNHGVKPGQLAAPIGRVWRIEAGKLDKPLSDKDFPPTELNLDNDVPF